MVVTGSQLPPVAQEPSAQAAARYESLPNWAQTPPAQSPSVTHSVHDPPGSVGVAGAVSPELEAPEQAGSTPAIPTPMAPKWELRIPRAVGVVPDDPTLGFLHVEGPGFNLQPNDRAMEVLQAGADGRSYRVKVSGDAGSKLAADLVVTLP